MDSRCFEYLTNQIFAANQIPKVPWEKPSVCRRIIQPLPLPLRAGGITVGILTLAHHQPGRYGSEARLITQTFAGYAAAAIQNNRLYASVREQAWVSAVLLKVAEANKEARTLMTWQRPRFT